MKSETHIIAVVSPAIKQAAIRAAEKDDVSLSHWVRRLIERALKKSTKSES